jgi:prolycopene isomerase
MMNIEVNPLACTGCGYCVAGCASGAIKLQIEAKPTPVIDAERCILCGDCLYICPNNVFSQPELEAKPALLEEAYDMIVIGAGIGGLMTAAGLVRAGKKVLVLEQLSFVGGKYTHLMHQGYAITTAAWTCPGPNSRIGKLMRKLEAEVRWITVHDVASRGDHWVVTPDGRKFSNLDETQETLVGGGRGMAQVYRWIADMYDPSVSYPDEMTTREYIEKYFPGNQEYIQYVETIITHCFASQTVDDFPAMETKRAIIDSLEQMKDWGTAYGGTAALVKAVEEEFHQHGGQIVTRTRVKRILLENGKAVGVELEDGRVLRAGIVLHNAGLHRLIELVGAENLPQEYLARLHSAVPANVAALILGTKTPLLGEKHSLLHAMGWERILNCYAPTFFDPGLAPQGRHVLDVFWAMKPPYDHARELEIVLGQLRKIFPDFDEEVEMQFPMFYTGRWTAEMAHRKQQSGAQRLNPQTPIENLYMVGYDCIGYGMAGDIIPHSVERALYLILKDEQFAPEDESSTARMKKWINSRLFRLLSFATRLKAGADKR